MVSQPKPRRPRSLRDCARRASILGARKLIDPAPVPASTSEHCQFAIARSDFVVQAQRDVIHVVGVVQRRRRYDGIIFEAVRLAVANNARLTILVRPIGLGLLTPWERMARVMAPIAVSDEDAREVASVIAEIPPNLPVRARRYWGSTLRAVSDLASEDPCQVLVAPAALGFYSRATVRRLGRRLGFEPIFR